jgi:hypothetical protein
MVLKALLKPSKAEMDLIIKVVSWFVTILAKYIATHAKDYEPFVHKARKHLEDMRNTMIKDGKAVG